MRDIGHFDSSHNGKVGVEILRDGIKRVDEREINRIVTSLNGDARGDITIVEDSLITKHACKILRDHADDKCEEAMRKGKSIEDMKIDVTRGQLSHMIGTESVAYLESLIATYD